MIGINDRVEIEIFRCGRCGKDVETKWAYSNRTNACLGYLSDPTFVFAGEVFFHPTCWDELVKECPP